MNCEIFETLYLKSNGEILCNDDSGEQICLDHIRDDGRPWSITGFFGNEQLTNIFQSFHSGYVPWPGVCEHCAFLRSYQGFSPNSRKHISKFQIETSLVCSLKCPGCSNHVQIRTRSKPWLMNPAILEKALKSIVEEGYGLDWIEYCGQGEPLHHPDFSSIVAMVRDYLPGTRQRLITNGNFNYQERLAGVFLDEIIVSCDGVDQRSYERYRIGGSLDKVLRFIEDCPEFVQGRRQNLIWKYILFSHNDTEGELIKAQMLAKRLGVNRLLFALTHSEGRSDRYTLETIGSIPIRYPNVSINAHPSFYGRVRFGKSRRSLEELFNRLTSSYKWNIDEVVYFPDNMIFLRGWIAGKCPIDQIELYLDGEFVTSVKPQQQRDDVRTKFPGLNTERAGFCCSGLAPEYNGNLAKLAFKVHAQGEIVARIPAYYNF